MMKEAHTLHIKVKAVAKDIHHFMNAADTALDSIKQVLATPLPKIYENDASAAAALMEPEVDTVAGKGYSAEAANRAKEDFSHKVAPRDMEAWMAKCDEAHVKQKLLNKAYDDMVNARTKVASAKSKEEALRRSGLGNEDQKVQGAVQVVQNLQDKLNVATEAYTHEEAGQYARLVSLNTEASTLGGSVRLRLGDAAEALAAVRDTIPESAALPTPAVIAAGASPGAPVPVPVPVVLAVPAVEAPPAVVKPARVEAARVEAPPAVMQPAVMTVGGAVPTSA